MAILQHSVIGRYQLVHKLSHMVETKVFSIEHLMVLFSSSREVLLRDEMLKIGQKDTGQI